MLRVVRRKRPPSHRSFIKVISTCNICAFLHPALSNKPSFCTTAIVLQHNGRVAKHRSFCNTYTPHAHTAHHRTTQRRFLCGRWHDLAVFLHRHGCAKRSRVRCSQHSLAALLRLRALGDQFLVRQHLVLLSESACGSSASRKAGTSAWRAAACGGSTCAPTSYLCRSLLRVGSSSSGGDERGQAEHSAKVRGWGAGPRWAGMSAASERASGTGATARARHR